MLYVEYTHLCITRLWLLCVHVNLNVMTNITEQQTVSTMIFPDLKSDITHDHIHRHAQRSKNLIHQYLLMINIQRCSSVCIQCSQTNSTLVVVSFYKRKPFCFTFTEVEQKGSQNSTSICLECNSLSRVSFGWFLLLKGHYLGAGKSLTKQQDNSGR